MYNFQTFFFLSIFLFQFSGTISRSAFRYYYLHTEYRLFYRIHVKYMINCRFDNDNIWERKGPYIWKTAVCS